MKNKKELPFFKNILTIASLRSDDDTFKERLHLKNLDLIKQANANNLLIAFVYCNPRLKKTKVEKIKNYKNVIDITLNTSESYGTLARKTFDTFKFFCKNYNFDFLYKADMTKVIDVKMMKLNQEAREDYFGCYAAVRKTKRDLDFFIKKGPFSRLKKVSRGNFARWAKRRGLKVDSSKFDGSVNYSLWKPYALSSKTIKDVVAKGEPYVDLYVKFLAGCEDHMVAKIIHDLNKK